MAFEHISSSFGESRARLLYLAHQPVLKPSNKDVFSICGYCRCRASASLSRALPCSSTPIVLLLLLLLEARLEAQGVVEVHVLGGAEN